MTQNSRVLVILALGMLLFGCAQIPQEPGGKTANYTVKVNETSSNGSNVSSPIQSNSTLLVALLLSDDSASASGRAPLWPAIRGGCYDQASQIVSCAIYQDGQLLAENIMANATYSLQHFKKAGPHTIEIRATNSKGEASSKTLQFNVSDTIDVWIEPLPSGADPAYISAVREAFAYWKNRDNITFREVQSPTPDSVQVNWLLTTMEGGAIGMGWRTGLNITLGTNNCYGNFSWYTPPSIMRIARHELGHSMGYDHSFDPDFVMNTSDPRTFPRHRVEGESTITLQPEGHYPFGICSAEDTADYNYNITASRPVDIRVVPSVEDYNNMAAGRAWGAYPACSFDAVTSVQFKCAVPKESFLIVLNRVQPTASATVHVTLWEEDCVGECKGRFSTTNSTMP